MHSLKKYFLLSSLLCVSVVLSSIAWAHTFEFKDPNNKHPDEGIRVDIHYQGRPLIIPAKSLTVTSTHSDSYSEDNDGPITAKIFRIKIKDPEHYIPRPNQGLFILKLTQGQSVTCEIDNSDKLVCNAK